jgi:ferredoxin
MAYVITNRCESVCDTACVDVCPCDVIHGRLEPEAIRRLPPEQRAGLRLYIEPEGCIDCAACVCVCPVGAIVHESEDEVARATNAAFFAKT